MGRFPGTEPPAGPDLLGLSKKPTYFLFYLGCFLHSSILYTALSVSVIQTNRYRPTRVKIKRTVTARPKVSLDLKLDH
jgi:hypothetical protein